MHANVCYSRLFIEIMKMNKAHFIYETELYIYIYIYIYMCVCIRKLIMLICLNGPMTCHTKKCNVTLFIVDIVLI